MPLEAAKAALLAVMEDTRARGLTALGAAVSGGGDSLALLDLAIPLARGCGLRLEAATVDHGLRPEAAAEARMVAGFCAARGLQHETLLWRRGEPAGNLSAEARAGRYAALASWGKRRGLAAILVAHNREDVAETFLIRLGRAAGLDGLAAMAPGFHREGMRFLRPLLDTPREVLRAHLRGQGIAWAEDPSNADTAYTRVKMRRLLEDLAAAGITPAAIAQSARALADTRAWAERQLSAEWQTRVQVQAGDLLIQGLPEDDEAARRLLVAAIRIVGASPFPPRREALARLRQGLEAGVVRQTLAGCLVTRKKGVLRIARELQAVRPLTSFAADWWDGRWQIGGIWPEGALTAPLAEGITQIKDWRDFSPLPRDSLMAGPALWCKGALIAAPLARPEPDYRLLLRKGFGSLPFLH
ncbi:tRNA lysidine(34) synthetase TilS [Falsigemmobacter faecalis]|uniref:tRNA(Ile)-lysidine synthase n=1 Tax=Falsigemmobacter faecalis TaxID=2488730 RepID=A0A3P3DMS7_9RHOB|nr:tRNA lysidine(34) synthetase TilS [Falsigemmobacter faecalis]RRH75471.1 tRNA lysidine(34) synthetase TilS [Falsigemmobacter faecalis]